MNVLVVRNSVLNERPCGSSDGNSDDNGKAAGDDDVNNGIFFNRKCQFYCENTEVCRFLNNMVTTSWSWESFDLVRGPKRGPDCSSSEDYLCFLSIPSVP